MCACLSRVAQANAVYATVCLCFACLCRAVGKIIYVPSLTSELHSLDRARAWTLTHSIQRLPSKWFRGWDKHRHTDTLTGGSFQEQLTRTVCLTLRRYMFYNWLHHNTQNRAHRRGNESEFLTVCVWTCAVCMYACQFFYPSHLWRWEPFRLPLHSKPKFLFGIFEAYHVVFWPPQRLEKRKRSALNDPESEQVKYLVLEINRIGSSVQPQSKPKGNCLFNPRAS